MLKEGCAIYPPSPIAVPACRRSPQLDNTKRALSTRGNQSAAPLVDPAVTPSDGQAVQTLPLERVALPRLTLALKPQFVGAWHRRFQFGGGSGRIAALELLLRGLKEGRLPSGAHLAIQRRQTIETGIARRLVRIKRKLDFLQLPGVLLQERLEIGRWRGADAAELYRTDPTDRRVKGDHRLNALRPQ